jgi:hypothetical protein
MTPEGRLDRIERIAKLFVKAGRRARSNMRDLDDKVNILINLHIQNEERFAKNEERFAKNEERFAKQDENIKILIGFQKQNEERFARTDERFVELAESQANSDRRINSLIDIIGEGRNGNS